VLEEPVLEAAGGAALLLSGRAQRKQQRHRGSGTGFATAAEGICEAGRYGLRASQHYSQACAIGKRIGEVWAALRWK
jgi:hypothetical protein